MKKTSFTIICLTLFSLLATAQTPIKVHSSGRVSLQSATASYGIQIPSSGVASFEPNIPMPYAFANVTKVRSLLTEAWRVKNLNYSTPDDTRFYVLGNGNVYAYGSYLAIGQQNTKGQGRYPVEGASDMVSLMNGYYYDSHEFEGVTPEHFTNNENILPGAVEGLLKDLAKDKVLGMDADALETVLPEAVRHDPEGRVAINYDAVLVVLVEAFKEQQARIGELEAVLKNNGLLKP